MRTAKQVLVDITNIRLDTWVFSDLIVVAMEEYAKEYHESKVKKLNIPDVINRRELLLDYTKWLDKQDFSKHIITLVDEYEKSSNSL